MVDLLDLLRRIPLLDEAMIVALGAFVGSALTMRRTRRLDAAAARAAAGRALAKLLEQQRAIIDLLATEQAEYEVVADFGMRPNHAVKWRMQADVEDIAKAYIADIEKFSEYRPTESWKVRHACRMIENLDRRRNAELRDAADVGEAARRFRQSTIEHALPQLERAIRTLAWSHSVWTWLRIRARGDVWKRALDEERDRAKSLRSDIVRALSDSKAATGKSDAD